MARELTNDFLNKINADSLSPAIFIKFEFINGTVNLWTGYNEIAFNGEVFIGSANILNIEPIQETQEIKASSVSFRFNNLNSALTATALTENYQGRPVTMWFGVLNDNMQIISSPYQLFKGRIDVIHFNDNGENSDFIVQCESNLIDIRKVRERRYTDEDQKIEYESDKGLEFISKIQDIEINWG